MKEVKIVSIYSSYLKDEGEKTLTDLVNQGWKIESTAATNGWLYFTLIRER